MATKKSKGKNPAAVALGRKGGQQRWAGLTDAERREHMRRLAQQPRPSRKKKAE